MNGMKEAVLPNIVFKNGNLELDQYVNLDKDISNNGSGESEALKRSIERTPITNDFSMRFSTFFPL